MKVTPGSTNVSTYVVLRLTSNGTEKTGATITDIDLQYCRCGSAPAAKVDATALAATDSAHADNKAIEVDSTDQPGLYRVDWPDAAFALGVREVFLTVKLAGCFTEHIRVELETLNLGTGLVAWDYTLTDGVDPIDNALVWVTTDAAGTDFVCSGYTNATGIVTFNLNPGTYYIWRQKSGWAFADPDTEVVAAP